MKKPRELAQWQKDDADRLHRAFDAYQAKTGASQFDVALEAGWNTQGALNQYIKGKIPLNWKALVNLSRIFGVHPGEISPTLTADNMLYQATELPESARQDSPPMTLISPTGKTMVIPNELVNAVQDLLDAWHMNTVTRRQLHAYRQIIRADAQMPELPPLKETKGPGITTNISKLIPSDPDQNQH